MDHTAATKRALAILASYGQDGARPGDVAEFRADPAIPALQGPSPYVAAVFTTSVDGPAGPIPVRVYRPVEDSTPRPGLIYYHGGGFVICDLDSHDGLCRALANGTGHVVLAVDYRRAPEHPFPAAPDDAEAAARRIAAEADRFGIDASRLSVMGDSAGGNLAAVVAQQSLEYGPAIAHQVLLVPGIQWPGPVSTASFRELGSGYYLTTEHLDWFVEHYRPDPNDPRAVPGLRDDLSGLPPATVITAELDPLRDEGEWYADRLASAGVDAQRRRFEGALHLFFVATAVEPRGQAELVDYVADRLGRP